MSIRFDLSAASPTLAANKLEAKSCGAVTTTEGAVLSRRARSPASDPQPNRPTLDPFYSDGREDPEGFLGTRSPTWIETVATRIYRTLNGGHLTWSYHSRWVVLFTDVGRACRVASFFMAVVICIVGYWILDPPIVGRFAISRNDELGDGLAFTTWMLWIANAAVFMLARLPLVRGSNSAGATVERRKAAQGRPSFRGRIPHSSGVASGRCVRSRDLLPFADHPDLRCTRVAFCCVACAHGTV